MEKEYLEIILLLLNESKNNIWQLKFIIDKFGINKVLEAIDTLDRDYCKFSNIYLYLINEDIERALYHEKIIIDCYSDYFIIDYNTLCLEFYDPKYIFLNFEEKEEIVSKFIPFIKSYIKQLNNKLIIYINNGNNTI